MSAPSEYLYIPTYLTEAVFAGLSEVPVLGIETRPDLLNGLSLATTAAFSENLSRHAPVPFMHRDTEGAKEPRLDLANILGLVLRQSDEISLSDDCPISYQEATRLETRLRYPFMKLTARSGIDIQLTLQRQVRTPLELTLDPPYTPPSESDIKTIPEYLARRLMHSFVRAHITRPESQAPTGLRRLRGRADRKQAAIIAEDEFRTKVGRFLVESEATYGKAFRVLFADNDYLI